MRKTFMGMCAAAVCAVTVGVGAQTPDTSTQKATGKTITVSGCVQRVSETGATGTTGAAGKMAAKFELTNAMIVKGAEATGTAGTSAATRYELDATDKQLAGHVNHKVEVTGTLEAEPGATGAAQKLKVQSVKMVSTTCQ